MPSDKYLLELQNVTKRYQRNDPLILKDITLSVKSGDGVIIMGESGSGKTTLLHIIAGMEPPGSGRILFRGADLKEMSDSRAALLRNNEISLCFQGQFLLSHLTILENITLPLIIRGEKRSVAREKGRKMLGNLGLQQMGRRKPEMLSGGQMQRLSLGRALIVEPILLLADEPTGNLDRRTASEVIDLILEYKKNNGGAFILVTHDEIPRTESLRRYSLKNGNLSESPATRSPLGSNPGNISNFS